jgi:hypothetical protein
MISRRAAETQGSTQIGKLKKHHAEDAEKDREDAEAGSALCVLSSLPASSA